MTIRVNFIYVCCIVPKRVAIRQRQHEQHAKLLLCRPSTSSVAHKACRVSITFALLTERNPHQAIHHHTTAVAATAHYYRLSSKSLASDCMPQCTFMYQNIGELYRFHTHSPTEKEERNDIKLCCMCQHSATAYIATIWIILNGMGY